LPSTARLVLPVLAILACIGVAALLFVTEEGIGITPDSVGYIRGARSLHAGQGLSAIGPDGERTALTHWPPLFPVVLSLLTVMGPDLIEGVRWLNAILFGANILLVGIIVRRYARGSLWLPLTGSFLTMVSIVMYRIHSQALSEPLFIFLVTLGLFLLARHTERPSIGLLAGASATISLGFLTRYAGIVYVLTGVLWLALPGRRNLYGKVRDAAVFGAVCIVPMALWMARNLTLSGGATNRALVFHPLTARFLSSAGTALSRWTLPWLALAFLLVALSVWRRETWANLAVIVRSIRPDSINLFGLSVIIYGLVIIASMSFIDRATSPDERILLPVYVSSLILTVCVGGAMICSARMTRFLKAVTIILLVFLAGSYCARSGRWIEEHRHDGQGYMKRAWRDSPTIAAVKSLPRGTLIFTQAQDAAYILGGRDAARIPPKVFPTSGLKNLEYEVELQHMLDRLQSEDGVIVYFDRIRRPYYPSREELTGRLPLQLVSRTEDGWIYRAVMPGSEPAAD